MSADAAADEHRYSLRRRLLARVGAAFAVLLLAMSALLWELARRGADQTYDLLLSGSALAMLGRVSDAEDGPTVDIPYSALEILGLAREERIAYRVFDASGRTITGDPSLPLPEGWQPTLAPRFFDAEFRGTPMRFTLQGRTLGSDGGRTLVLVEIGQTRDARDAQQLLSFATSVAGLGAVALVGLLFVRLAINRALSPLATIEADLRRREPTDLSALTAEPPREVRRLIGAINGFIARLRTSREHAEGFIADVAHQTRTSLSALDGQLSLAAEAPDPDEMRRRVTRAADHARRTVRLTDQLLAHAMVIHRADGGERVALAPVPLVRALLVELLRGSALAERGVGLDVEGVSEDERIVGDAVAIREALRNVIDNAVRHGAGPIDVAVRAEAGQRIAIVVDDAGPGIPPARREEALGRFVSLEPRSGGSGLGLAIVRAVAGSHDATLELGDAPGGGLRVRLSFPAARGSGGGRGRGDRGDGERGDRTDAERPREARVVGTGTARTLAVALLVLAFAPSGTRAADDTLSIWSATDTAAVEAVIERFEAQAPTVRVRYREFQTVALHAHVLSALETGSEALPDVVISSAMDLQVDLVNRGLARAFDVPDASAPPDWASWRRELRGFTREPAAVVYDRVAMAGRELPATHLALADAIRDDAAFFDARIGTYDIRRSGIGYLFATQDATQGQQFQRLTESLGRARARVYCCTSAMIEAISAGELVMGVNVIGSYALAAAERDPAIGVHFFDDYNLVMSRTAFVPAGARNPILGERFVGFLLSADGQRAIAERSALLPIAGPAPAGDVTRRALSAPPDGAFLPLRLGPGLLTWLDRLKQERFIAAWEASLRPDARRRRRRSRRGAAIAMRAPPPPPSPPFRHGPGTRRRSACARFSRAGRTSRRAATDAR